MFFVVDYGIKFLLASQSQLECLTLRKLKTFTGESLANVTAKTLEKVDLRGCSNLTSAGKTNASS